VNGKETTGQDAGSGQESESRKEVEALAQQQAVGKQSVTTIRAGGGAGGYGPILRRHE